MDRQPTIATLRAALFDFENARCDAVIERLERVSGDEVEITVLIRLQPQVTRAYSWQLDDVTDPVVLPILAGTPGPILRAAMLAVGGAGVAATRRRMNRRHLGCALGRTRVGVVGQASGARAYASSSATRAFGCRYGRIARSSVLRKYRQA